MCGDCEVFSLCRSQADPRNLLQVLFGRSLIASGMLPAYRAATVDPVQLFTCFNCSAVKDSLWIVSYVVDVSAIDECSCCVECLVRNCKDPAFSCEHKISLRCLGENCSLQLDTWTKAPELVISILEDHTDKCPTRPIFCPRGCKSVIRRQDRILHEKSCIFRSTPEETEALKMEEVESRLIVPPVKTRYQKMTDVPLKHRGVSNSNPASEASHETLRKEVLNESRRSSAAFTAVDDSDSMTGAGSLGHLQRSSAVNRSGSQSGRSNTNGGLSDECLEQLEKARVALEQHGVDVPDGLSLLPEVFAQKLSTDDLPSRDRVEKLEEILATTRAQLEKAFMEIRNLRALLASESKLRQLHVNKLRDEIDLLKISVHKNAAQRPSRS